MGWWCCGWVWLGWRLGASIASLGLLLFHLPDTVRKAKRAASNELAGFEILNNFAVDVFGCSVRLIWFSAASENIDSQHTLLRIAVRRHVALVQKTYRSKAWRRGREAAVSLLGCFKDLAVMVHTANIVLGQGMKDCFHSPV